MNSSRINITYIIDAIGWAGAQTHLISVLTNIDYSVFNVSVVCVRYRGVNFDILKNLHINSLVLNLENLMSPLKTLKAVFILNKFLKENNTHIFHSYMFNPNLIASIMSLLPWTKFKLITTRRDTGYWHQRHHWWMYKFMNLMTDKIIAVSSEVRLESIRMEGVSPKKIITIFNGIDVEVYSNKIMDRTAARSEFGIKEDEFVIGILAAIRPEKRHDIFVIAASKIIDVIPKLRFMIVGEGYEKTKLKVTALITKHNLNDHFILTGKLTNVIPALSAFDISILCSDTEGMSNTVLQSISMGKATIVTNVGGNPEVIKDGVNGLLIPPDDPDAMAKAIISLYKNSNKKLMLEQQAVNVAKNKFNIYPIVESLQDVYLDLVADNS